MIRGDFVSMTEAELNSVFKIIPETEFAKKHSGEAKPYHKMITMDEWCDKDYDSTDSFREQCLEAGYYLLKLYPVYHQGWEMDEWGAIGQKDGVQYRLETNHGSLVPTPLRDVPWYLKSIKALFFGDDDG